MNFTTYSVFYMVKLSIYSVFFAKLYGPLDGYFEVVSKPYQANEEGVTYLIGTVFVSLSHETRYRIGD